VQNLEEYTTLLEYASSLCSLQINNKLDIKQERQRFKEAFLFDLLYGNFKKREEILSYGEIWNWNFSLPYVVLVFSLIDFSFYSADKHLIHTLAYIVENGLITNAIQPITFSKQNEVVVVFPINQQTIREDKKKVKDFLSYVFTQTTKMDLLNRVGCGVGKVYNEPENLFRSYQEAKVALELGQLLEIPIPFFNDLGLERILYKHDLQDLREFYKHILGVLEHYDSEHGGELMYTLENFAKYQFDLKLTSEALYLHRNTLRYRIKKIEEVMNIRLDDINNKLDITAALKIKQLHKEKL
jgi:sugar diacid utilization regulator